MRLGGQATEHHEGGYCRTCDDADNGERGPLVPCLVYDLAGPAGDDALDLCVTLIDRL